MTNRLLLMTDYSCCFKARRMLQTNRALWKARDIAKQSSTSVLHSAPHESLALELISLFFLAHPLRNHFCLCLLLIHLWQHFGSCFHRLPSSHEPKPTNLHLRYGSSNSKIRVSGDTFQFALQIVFEHGEPITPPPYPSHEPHACG